MRNSRILLFAAVTMLTAGCAKEMEQSDEDVNFVKRTYVATIGEDTKTSIDDDGNVSWNFGESVYYFTYPTSSARVKETTVKSEGNFTDLTFEIPDTAEGFFAFSNSVDEVWYNSASDLFLIGPPLCNTERSGSFGDDHFSAVKVTDLNSSSIHFKNITSHIKFTLDRDDIKKVVFTSNDGTSLAGNVQLLFDDNDNMTAQFLDDSPSITIEIDDTDEYPRSYYIATLPCTLSTGFTLDCYGEDDVYIGTAKSDKSTEIKSNTILDLGTIDSRLVKNCTDLSSAGTANCYIVPSEGHYKFKASVKGNSTQSVGEIAFAEVLWESFGTGDAPSVGDLVSGVSYENDSIYFTASNKNGNAVIAAKDGCDNILWSWHIWMTDQPADQVYNNDAGTMMDRNLGATSATPGNVGALGLLYQWGRKDPFLGSADIDGPGMTASTIDWPGAVTSDSSTGTIAYAVANPTTFISLDEDHDDNEDWYYNGNSSADTTRWGSEKAVYDPCPVGYKVPEGEIAGIWVKAIDASLVPYWHESHWDDDNRGLDFGSTDFTFGSGTIWYPAAGYIGEDGELNFVGDNLHYWSCTHDDTQGACAMTYLEGLDVYLNAYPSSACGASVRCCKE